MPTDIIRKWISLSVFFNRAILDEAVRLGKSGEETDRFAATTTDETPDENKQSTKADPAQIPAVVTQSPKCFRPATVGTLFRWQHPLVKTFGDILLWINIDGVNELHRCFYRNASAVLNDISKVRQDRMRHILPPST